MFRKESTGFLPTGRASVMRDDIHDVEHRIAAERRCERLGQASGDCRPDRRPPVALLGHPAFSVRVAAFKGEASIRVLEETFKIVS